jgi:hypothetical protein
MQWYFWDWIQEKSWNGESTYRLESAKYGTLSWVHTADNTVFYQLLLPHRHHE